MLRKRLYELGKKLGLTENDIDNILSTGLTEVDSVESSLPVEVYKGVIEYGTISIKDFK